MRYRSLTTTTKPLVEPVSLSEAKTHCRVDTSTDDAYITSLITAARQWVEEYVDRALIAQQLTLRLDRFPYEFELPRPPMATSGTLTSTTITYTLETQATATLDTATYRVDRNDTPGRIRTVYAGTWPGHLADQNAVTVTWWAGYGPAATDVPQAIRHAILMLVGHLYERRLASDNVGGAEVPFGVKALLDSQKWGSYA